MIRYDDKIGPLENLCMPMVNDSTLSQLNTTRMHSSRMHTVRNSCRLLGGGGCLVLGGVWSGGVVSQHALRQTPPYGQTDTCKNITFATSLRTVKMEFIVKNLSAKQKPHEIGSDERNMNTEIVIRLHHYINCCSLHHCNWILFWSLSVAVSYLEPESNHFRSHHLYPISIGLCFSSFVNVDWF